MLVIAVTGGIGSGKSTVAGLFRQHHVPVIDTDEIARELVQPGQPALAEIIRTFGEAFKNSDGSLHRRALRELIFTDAQARAQLETILHPRIHAIVLEAMQNYHQDVQTGDFPAEEHSIEMDDEEWEALLRLLESKQDE